MKKQTINGATWVNRKRRDLPLMTPPMMLVLIALRAAAEADSPFIHITDVHPRTLNSLVSRDWIFASPGMDGTRYRITGRGLKALKVYEPVEYRRDGICPDCGKNPKHVTRSGRVECYCAGCLKKMGKRKYRLGIGKNPETLCPRCKQRPRHREPGGAVNTYCKECGRVLKREAKTEKRRAQLALLKVGGFIKCHKPGCDACVHFTEVSVYELCAGHWHDYLNAYNDRRRANSKAAKSRRQKADR